MKETNQLKTEVWEKIQSGKFRNHFLIYSRKSTDEPDNQKNSIKYQRSENTRFAFREHLPIANITIEGFCTNGIISEKHSAFKEDTDLIIGANGTVQYRIERPKFHQLIQYLNAGFFKGVIVLCWDRISRNKGDETIIHKLIKTGCDFRFVLATYDKTSAGALHMDIDGMFAEHHSRVTSEKVKINIYNQKEKGVCTYKAPVGYLNKGSMLEKPIDAVRGPLIKRFFELYSTGEWTISSLVRFAIDQGFTMPARRRKRTAKEMLEVEDEENTIKIEKVERIINRSVMHKILTNPFYVGKIRGNDGLFIKSASHKPLVSEQLFAKVQQLLTVKNVSSHYSKAIQYPYRGMIRCGGCKRVFTPYAKKGILYYRARCSYDCNNKIKNHNVNDISNLINESILKMQLSENEMKEFGKKAKSDLVLLERKRVSRMETYDREKKVILENLTFLQTNKLNLLKTRVYSPEAFLQEENTLNERLLNVEKQMQSSDIALNETIKDVIILSELLKDVVGYSYLSNPMEKERIYKNIFSELSLFENSLKFQCKNGFSFFQSRLVSNGAHKDPLLELPVYAKVFKEDIRLLKEIIDFPKTNYNN